jgi:2-keto-4-pentenoate hydratase/2-oxohepta-3-ene-1,7-dioic acid hydratase in catechol pathway
VDRISPPVVPRTSYAAGLNYLSHIEWANNRHARHKVPEWPDIGYRASSALIGSGEEIVIPADSAGPVEYEGELVAVIGKKARNLAEGDALDCVRGYTLGNDISERSWQRSDRTLWRAKSAATFKPMEPKIVSGIDPMNQVI